MIGPLDAVVLGAVEGLTEFLPVSSTGHLILASALLGLEGEAVHTFEVVIQAGALGAVLGLYWKQVRSLFAGLLGKDPAGLRLLRNLLLSFLPAAAAGLLFHDWIKGRLFSVGPVAAALALGGVAMIVLDWQLAKRGVRPRPLDSMTWQEALIIGLFQCGSLWPGTSRAMMTIVGALLLQFPPAAAAEYSFLLALPTLGAATLFDAAKGGARLVSDESPAALALGLFTAAIVAAFAIRGFVRYVSRFGMALFGWYRIGLAMVMGIWMQMR